MAVSFAQGGQVEAALNKLKDHLAANAGSIKRMFQLIDKDLSNQIDVDEFIEVLKACNIVLPPYILKGLVARFDLNGDGYISIPEFTSFMSGDSDRMEMLRDAPGAPAKPATPPPPQQSYGKMPMQQKMRAVTSEGLSRRDFVFVQRMQRDLETRRQTQFINEIKKDPRFQPSMLEEPNTIQFQQVTLDTGPIIKIHNPRKTGYETAKPFKWGPLGGYY